eukprot:UN00079
MNQKGGMGRRREIVIWLNWSSDIRDIYMRNLDVRIMMSLLMIIMMNIIPSTRNR